MTNNELKWMSNQLPGKITTRHTLDNDLQKLQFHRQLFVCFIPLPPQYGCKKELYGECFFVET